MNGKTKFLLRLIQQRHGGSSVKKPHGRFKAFRQTASGLIADLESIHHDFHRRFRRPIPLLGLITREDLAADAQTDEPTARHIRRKAPHALRRRRRSQNQHLRVFRERERRIHHVVNAASGERHVMMRAVRAACS